MRAVSLVALFLLQGCLTGGAWALASTGAGLSDDLRQNASLRAGSATGGRVLVGGGIHSGK